MKIRSLLIGLAVCLGAWTANAQEWPARPVRLVVPVPPGGALDPFVRAMAVKLGDALKQPFIVENKPGASGSVGTASVAKSAPDGYTFAFVFDTHAVNPALIARMPFDTVRDLVPVMLVARAPMLIVTHPNKPFQTFAQVVEQSKLRPESISIGTAGNGSIGHLAVLQMAREDGVKLTNVPYKGGGPLMQDVLGGQVDLGISAVGVFLPYVRNKQVRPLAVASEQRSAAMPDVPTLSELGLNVSANTWWAVFAPTGTPQNILDRFHAELAKALDAPDIKKMLTETFGMEIVASSPDRLQQFTTNEIARWGKVVREHNVRTE